MNKRSGETVLICMRRFIAILVVVLVSPFGLLKADDQGPVKKTGEMVKSTADATGRTISHGAKRTGQFLSNGAKATARTVGKAIEKTGTSVRNVGA
jgi:hypothetical protein